MRVISLNVGEPRMVPYLAGEVATGIFKEHVEGPLMLRRLNFEGDRQAGPRQCTAEKTRPSTPILPNIIHFGSEDFRTWICRGECSEKI